MKIPVEIARWLVVLGVTVAALPSARAQGIPPGPGCIRDTFTSYERLGGFGCPVGILRVFNFDLFLVDTAGRTSTPPPAFVQSIFVDPVYDAATKIMTMVVGGFGPYPVAADQTSAYRIDFAVDPPPIVSGERIEIDPPFGNVAGSQLFCREGQFEGSFCGTGAGSASFSIGSPAFVPFDPAIGLLATQTTFRLNPNGDTASRFDSLVFSIYTIGAQLPVSPTPEPATWTLLSAGLIFAATRRRTRKD